MEKIYTSIIKKKVIGSILLIISLIASLFIITNTNNNRKNYEKFLEQEYKKIPVYASEVLRDIPKPDRPDQAAIRDYFMTMDPELKAVPGYRLNKAYKQTLALQQTATFKSGGNALSWQEKYANKGGRTRTIMFDPNDPNHGKVWAGAVTGGLWYIEDFFDNHENWHAVDDFWSNLSISSMAYDPNNTQLFYVGTGESQTAVNIYRESSGRGSGIYKSFDGGVNWELLPSTEDFAYVSDIVVRDENGQSVIYAAVLSGQYHGDQQSTPTDGLYKSTNGGNTWNQVLPNIDGLDVPYAVSDIQLSSDQGRIFVGTTYNLNGDGASCILYSDNGTDWTLNDNYRINILAANDLNIPGRVMLSAAPSDPNIIIAGIVAGRPGMTGGFVGFNCSHIIKTTDKGENWDELSLPGGNPGFATIAWHALIIRINPDNPDVLWAGGLNLWRSLDGGLSWTELTNWFGGGDQYVHGDHHSIEYRPESSHQMLFGTDGGVFKTEDGTLNLPVFSERNHNFNTLQYYTCAIHPDAGRSYYTGGLQDNGTILYRGERPITTDDAISGGDGAYCFIDNIVNNIGVQTQIITNSQYNRLYYHVGNSNTRPTYVSTDVINIGDFINPSDYDTLNNILIQNAGSTQGNLRDSILFINVPDVGQRTGAVIPVYTGQTGIFSNVKVSRYSVAGNTKVILGTQSGRLFKVNNAADAPETIDIGSPDFPTGYISGIDIGQNEDEIIVTFSNYGVASVWITIDGGVNWRNIEGNLPDMPVRWVIFHPQNSNQALIATEIGVWEATDLNEENVEWLPVKDGMANVRVDMLRVRAEDNTVLVATHGRGLYTGIWPVASYSGIDNNILSDLKLKTYPNPVHDVLNVSFYLDGIKNAKLEINDLNGKTILIDNIANIDGNYSKEIDMSSYSAGIYFVNISTKNSVQTKKIILR
ncbi:T9SS type A sorting domain-containing protein [Bacteroidota bacterium]